MNYKEIRKKVNEYLKEKYPGLSKQKLYKEHGIWFSYVSKYKEFSIKVKSYNSDDAMLKLHHFVETLEKEAIHNYVVSSLDNVVLTPNENTWEAKVYVSFVLKPETEYMYILSWLDETDDSIVKSEDIHSHGLIDIINKMKVFSAGPYTCMLEKTSPDSESTLIYIREGVDSE